MPIPHKTIERRARLFRNGRNQAVRIPREFELPGDEVLLYSSPKRVVERASSPLCSQRAGSPFYVNNSNRIAK